MLIAQYLLDKKKEKYPRSSETSNPKIHLKTMSSFFMRFEFHARAKKKT